MDLSSLADLLKLVVLATATIFAGAWTYLVWCVKRIADIYRERADLAKLEAEVAIQEHRARAKLAETELDQLRNRVATTDSMISVFQRSISQMKRDLASALQQLGETTVERDGLQEKLSELLEQVETIRRTDDPLAKVLATQVILDDKADR